MIATTTSAAGRREADLAIASHESRRQRLLLQAKRWFVELLGETEDATTDQLRERRPELAHVHAAMGAIPKALSRAGIIRAVGWRESSRETSHSRPMRAWRLVSHDVAATWLAANPLPIDPECDSPRVQRVLFAGDS